jgi:hypothetical protein
MSSLKAKEYPNKNLRHNALRIPRVMYSHNAFAQIFNTGIANVGIAELTWYHLEQVAITPTEVVPDKAELEEHKVSVKTEDRLLAYIAAAATIAGGRDG